MRVILNTLAEEYRPHSSSAVFTDLWNRPEVSHEFMNLVFDRWRARNRLKDETAKYYSASNQGAPFRQGAPTHSAAAPQRKVHPPIGKAQPIYPKQQQILQPIPRQPQQPAAAHAQMRRPHAPNEEANSCLLYTSPSPRDRTRSRMPSSA